MDLDKLVSLVNEHASYYKILNAANAEAIIDHIKSLVNPYHIKVIFEHLSCLDKQPKFRVILSVIKHKADFKIPLVKKCNGLILSLSQLNEASIACKVLAIPPN